MERGFSLTSADAFDSFWEDVLQLASQLDIDEPVLPRKRRVPAKLGGGKSHCFEDPKALYAKQYATFLETIIEEVRDRFQRTGMDAMVAAEELLVNVANGKSYTEALSAFVEVFGRYVDSDRLKVHLDMSPDLFTKGAADENGLNLEQIAQTVCGLKSAGPLFSELKTVLKILYTVPCSSAQAERSFSALRRLKSYLRSTMSQQRLNHVVLMNVHRERVDRFGSDVNDAKCPSRQVPFEKW